MRDSEEKYRSILEEMEDGYYEVDLRGNLTIFNGSLAKILDRSPEELMGLNYREYTDKENSEQVLKPSGRCLQQAILKSH